MLSELNLALDYFDPPWLSHILPALGHSELRTLSISGLQNAMNESVQQTKENLISTFSRTDLWGKLDVLEIAMGDEECDFCFPMSLMEACNQLKRLSLGL